MAKNEIKVRKQLLDDATLHRHRDYSLLLKQHERSARIKRTKRFFIYSLLVALVVILLLSSVSYFLFRLEKSRELKLKNSRTSYVQEGWTKKSPRLCDFHTHMAFLS